MMHRERSAPVIGMLVLLALVTAAPPVTAGGGGDGGTGLQSRLEEYLARFDASGFAFSALVELDGHIVVRAGYGRIDSAHAGRAADRTLFNIASITKSFTAVAVLSLAERGTLGLDDSITKFFDGVPGDKRAVTVAELLTHTSGLAQNYSADGIADRDSAVRMILRDSLAFAPGTGFSYSNENYELLGAIIETVTGRPYETALRELILTKAGMSDTRFWGEPAGDAEIRIAPKTRELDPAMLARNWGYIGSGGIYSNVADLHRWFRALTGGRLLRQETIDRMWTVRWKSAETSVAYGWFISEGRSGREIWTRGTEDWGHNAVLRWFPDRGALIIVMSNSGERGDRNLTANRIISDGIVRMMFE